MYMYPNLKTNSHNKLKFFLRTKLLENLLLQNIPYIYKISIQAVT